ncbi:MAG: hypothetical protein ACLR56_08890 [Oscillospiraceae bacterium]
MLNKLQIMKLVSVVCERDFDVPAVNESGGDIFITLSEHAALRVDVGIAKMCFESMMCGTPIGISSDGHGILLPCCPTEWARAAEPQWTALWRPGLCAGF